MSALVVLALLAAPASAGEGPLRFDRIDVLSDNSAAFLSDDLPRAPLSPAATLLRFTGQVSGVFSTEHIEIASSLSVQSLGLRAPISRAAGWWLDGAIVARGLLPVGGRASLALRRGPVRIGLSLCAESQASWTSPSWFGDQAAPWLLRPALGIGFGRNIDGRAPWMR